MKKLLIIGLLFVSLGLFTACKNDNPSVIKVFVRSASNELVEGAKVIIIGDVNSNPETMSWVDTVVTNNSGFAYFSMRAYYEAAGAEDNPVAYFDIIAKTATKEATGYIRSRVHTTAVETIFLPN
mmetsp:Transcript_6298/g.7045  ORF Transcript_6298/g.7045 Transcript_6298/m.7045 type:complete len:125 (+) Transcript_6298:128-502(+)